MAPAGASYAGAVDLDCDLLVLGGGSGGYSAAFRAAELGLKVILVERCAQLGGGIIGLEMGTVYSTLRACMDVVEMLDGLMQGAARDLVKIWQKMNAKRFDNIMHKTKTVSARPMARRSPQRRLAWPSQTAASST